MKLEKGEDRDRERKGRDGIKREKKDKKGRWEGGGAEEEEEREKDDIRQEEGENGETKGDKR